MTRYLRTEMVSLDQLTPFPGNARRGRVDVIKESIEKNGQYRSLIVREIKNGPQIVLAGNHTMTAISELGGTQARCEFIDCDDDTARRINLVDNRSNDLAEDDEQALALLLRDLEGDGAGTGYTDEEIAGYVGDLEAALAVEAPQAPEDFAEFDETIKTEHTCPKCGYHWSGGSK
jgi:ParB-like chromosome segregation protein Spo0J